MKILPTGFEGLKIIQSEIYKDYRGFFKEDYKKKFFKNKNFIFGCTSSSKKNVLRGSTKIECFNEIVKTDNTKQVYHLHGLR